MICIFLLVWLVINHFDWQFFLVCGGKEYKMEFSVEVFRQKPSYDILGSLSRFFIIRHIHNHTSIISSEMQVELKKNTAFT